MKKIYTLLLAVSASVAVNAQATIITEWNFNDQTTNPSVGEGTLTLIGGIMPWDNPGDDIPAGYSSGCNPVTLLLEDGTGTGNWAYNSTAYPAQGTNPDTAGFLFHTSTEGAVDEVSFIFNLRRSGTASTYFSVFSSLDGTNWDLIATESNMTTDFAAYGGPYLVPNGTNAPQLYIKVVSSFAPGTNQYGATGNYGEGGTIRLDNVRVFTGTLLATEEISTQPIVANTVWYNEAIFNAQGKTAIEVYDISGQKVKSFSGNETFKVNVGDLVKGVYVVKIITANKIITQKVIKK
ncbi:T9SS type A sorting domain-containing protein [Moheibacter sediminis]|uniref:Por secretion system C-terminal sorting domain-containing protein n=1 Tax=Moheibacter sediminis TaxID=1434700 RepID=A0A1W1YHE8_9FLAO|nr:T9SS type A sorting domain-containing protein [Moheibacter sediminis]SMC35607.1 Por secretion system C-terminal sorting domain-containing protein [Moheibacter sediminis]